MPDRFNNFLQLVGGIAPPILVALLGGLVRLLRGPGPCSLRYVVATIVTAAFTGYLTHEALSSVPVMPDGVKTACVGIAGYAGGKLLDIMTERFCKVAERANPLRK